MLGKTLLLEAIASKNRGLLATDQDRQAILAAAAQLEDHNPTARPLEAPDLLAGNWRLLYTTSRGLLGLDRWPGIKLGQIYQCIRPQEARIYNIAEFYGFPFLEGLVAVAARLEPLSERRVQVLFERSIFGLQRLLRYESPDDLIARAEAQEWLPAIDLKLNSREQQGWLDITYLDADLRIGRGNEGNLFVLSKV